MTRTNQVTGLGGFGSAVAGGTSGLIAAAFGFDANQLLYPSTPSSVGTLGSVYLK